MAKGSENRLTKNNNIGSNKIMIERTKSGLAETCALAQIHEPIEGATATSVRTVGEKNSEYNIIFTRTNAAKPSAARHLRAVEQTT